MRALSDERDTCIKTTKQLEAQIQHAESAQKMQMDRANERQKNYERALYDTRQVLAMKDAKIATLEANLQRAGQVGPPPFQMCRCMLTVKHRL